MGWDKVQQHPRFKVQLAAKAIIRSIEDNNDESADTPALVTQTNDISASGLSLFVPSLPFVFAYLLSPDNIVKLVLELPGGLVRLEATLIHDRPITERDAFPGYVITGLADLGAVSDSLLLKPQDATESAWLIGLKFKKISESDSQNYLSFLNSLH